MPGFRNTVLRNVDPSTIEQLRLQKVELKLEQPLEEPGEEIRNLYFIEAGLGSMTTRFSDGHQVEVGLFGYEAVVGVSAFMGTKRSLNAIFMQGAGWGYRSTIKTAEKVYRQYGRFHELCLRFIQAQLLQTAQTAACNATHSVEQRLARWLLLCRDRLQTDKLPLTHEFLAQMLGTRRTSVTLAARAFADLGAIKYSRGHLEIVNRKLLEELTCDCYKIVREHLNNYHQIEIGFGI